MAIPFNLPSEPETEANYTRLDQLLLDLYEILRLILIRNRRRERGDELEVVPGNELGAGERMVTRKPPLPPRRRRRPPPPLPPKPLTVVPPAHCQPSIWLNVGIQLGQITEVLRTRQQTADGVEEEKLSVKKKMEVEGSLLMSLFVPSTASGTFWTTLILFVGWKLLTRHR